MTYLVVYADGHRAVLTNSRPKQFEKALEINPNDPETHYYNLGSALVQKGQLDSAIAQFQEVLLLKPDFSPAQDKLDKAQALARGVRGSEF